jgi:glycosyltransferase involved in cell wall biosynthesis
LTGEIQRLAANVLPDVVHLWNAEARAELAFAVRGITSTTLVETISHASAPQSDLRQAIENRVASRFHAVAIPHDTLREPLIESGYPATHIATIPNATADTPLDRLTSKHQLADHLGLPSSIHLAVAHAPLEPRFRLKDLVWATDLLHCVRDDFHLLIVGAGQQGQRLKRFHRQTKAIGHVHFLDQPTNAMKLETVYAAADVYWNSHLNSPCPAPLLQAMAAGAPAISVLGPSTESVIQHQATGFAVNFGARDEFARWTKYLIEQTAAARQLSQQSRDFARTTFPVEPMIGAYSDWYSIARKRAN